jgi:iron complex outermembrane receptor protein
MKISTLSAGVAAALAAGLTSAPVMAQQGEAAGALEEVIVTATRRAQDLQEVPVSIVALTGDSLETLGLDSLEDVGNYIPNINIQGGGAGTFGPTFRVRGLPNVGVYVDGVWQVNTAGFLTQDFVEIDRVEVLRGPQGTTYGRDAVGGAIRIWTTEPSDEFGGRITATTGSNSRRDVQANLDLPLSDNLLTKWTASSQKRDGFIQSLSVDREYGESDQQVFRGDILWTPSDRLSVRVVHSQDDLKLTEPRIQDAIFDTGVIPGPDGVLGTPDDVQNWGVLMKDFYRLAIEQNPDAYPGFLPYTPENYTSGYPGGRIGRWETASKTGQPSQIEREQTTVDVTWDVTDNISIQFLTAYQDVATDIIIDWDGADYDIVSDLSRTRLDVFSEEIQISGGSGRVNWVGGLYYWDEESVTRADRRTLGDFFTYPGVPTPLFDVADVHAHPQCVALRDPAGSPAPGQTDPVTTFAPNPVTNPTGAATCGFAAFFAENIFAYDRLNFNNQDGYALFGEATVTLTDQLDLTLGLRHHDQDVEAGALAFIPGVTAPQTSTADVLHTGGDPFAGTRIIDPDAPPVTFDEQTIKVALQMQFTQDIMGYVSYSEGFNSGGIDSITTDQQLWFPYDPEVIENTEIGIRSDLLGGQLRLNATYFDSDWTNIQNDGVVRDPDSGVELPSLATTNVGTANANGLELELTYAATDNFLVNFNLGLLDTEYTDIAEGTSFLDESTEFQQAPDSTWNIGLQHTADLASGGSITTRVDYAYTDQFWRSLAFLRVDQYGVKNGGPIPANFDESGDWGTVNARVTYEAPDGDYAISLFGTNLTDEYMLNSGFFHGIWGYDFATVSRPREVGLSLTMRFD